MRRSATWVLLLLAVTAILANPFATGACLCCPSSEAPGCCGPPHSSRNQAPEPDGCQWPVAACTVMPGSVAPAPASDPVPAPAMTGLLFQAGLESKAAVGPLLRLLQRRPRPRTPLLEGGTCLHTALQPPAAL